MNNKKILVIEDDQYLRDLIVEKLKRENFEVFEAVDGEVGWKMTNNHHPDLVILDIILPLLNGFDYLEMLRKKPDVAQTQVIILSNLGQPDDVERGKNLGVKDYLVKAHFTPNDLVDKVKQHL